MNWNKYKALIILGTISGSAIGAIIAAILISPSWYIMIVAFFALIGIMCLATLTVAILVDIHNENKKDKRISRLSNWGWDKSFED